MDMISVATGKREEFVNITSQVQALIKDKGRQNGALVLFCAHTTGALTINESADPAVVVDILSHLRKLIPRDDGFRHMEGNSDAHIKSSLVGPDLTLLVENGRLQLGTWQGVFFCEFDGPRTRKVWARWLPGD